MASSFFSSVRQGFTRPGNKSPNPQQQAERGHVQMSNNQSPIPYTSPTPPAPPSPSVSPGIMSNPDQSAGNQARNPPYFFREKYSNLIVRGNLTTLAVLPKHVEKGEWLAHQVVEQYRLLDSMLQVIRVVDERTNRPICNPETCPTMSAAGHTYTWLNNQKQPVKIPACQYVQLVQTWVMGKISNPSLFPTDTTTPTNYSAGGVNTPTSSTPIAAGPTTIDASLNALSGRDWLGKTSGFPENFASDIKGIYRQMMRCYAHLYHGHWLTPFWDTNSYKELNTCFIHFINVGMTFDLITIKEMEPMWPLIDLWMKNGLLPNQNQEAEAAQAQAQAQAQIQSQGQQQAPAAA
ncbi:Mob1/phocein [Microthyrium microscopicum]|uniref:Mob1/phocein n=1 Tax=Microthyrium microscopicum TaxID=703497 RepID=A0A6A6U6F1_9PEZI|nr:Mob1/phocein [Microthyrium microscopicum]